MSTFILYFPADRHTGQTMTMSIQGLFRPGGPRRVSLSAHASSSLLGKRRRLVKRFGGRISRLGEIQCRSKPAVSSCATLVEVGNIC